MRTLGGPSPRISHLCRHYRRDKHNELRATQRTVRDLEVAALRLGCCARDSQTQAGPKTAVAQPLEFAKDAVPRGSWDARPGVAYNQSHTATLNAPDDGYRRTGWSMDANVLQQVTHVLVDQAGAATR